MNTILWNLGIHSISFSLIVYFLTTIQRIYELIFYVQIISRKGNFVKIIIDKVRRTGTTFLFKITNKIIKRVLLAVTIIVIIYVETME